MVKRYLLSMYKALGLVSDTDKILKKNLFHLVLFMRDSSEEEVGRLPVPEVSVDARKDILLSCKQRLLSY